MHNIAEGFDAGTDKQFIQFLGYARRSASEVQSQLYAALDQGFITQHQFNQIYESATICKKKINGLLRYLITKKGNIKEPEEGYSVNRNQVNRMEIPDLFMTQNDLDQLD